MVQADGSRLRQLLESLVRNSLDHGGAEAETPVTVTVGDLEDGFYVADDGVGIPEAHGWSVELAESEEGGVRFEFTGTVAPRPASR